MSTDRDTKFLGFADLLQSKLESISPCTRQEASLVIAQSAYDLLFFLIDKAPYHSGSFDAGYGTPDEIREVIERLPDLTGWPIPPV